MTEAEAAIEGEAIVATRPVAPASAPIAWRAICGIFLLVAGLIFAYNGARYFDETQKELRLIPWLSYDNRVDFNYFYAGADMAWHGDAAELYPNPGEFTFFQGDLIFREPRPEYENARLLARGNYYNPPILAFIQSPLTTLRFSHAFWLFSALGAIALAGYAALAWRAGRRVPEMPLLIVGVLAFKPVHEAVIMGHMTLFFVLTLTAGFLALRARQPALTGLAFSLLALKPQWAILPAVFLLANREWRGFAVMAVCSSVIFVSGFVITGWETFENYYHFLRFQAELDLWDAPHMFSWNGFLYKIEEGPFGARPGNENLTYVLIAITAAVMLLVWLSRDFYLAVASTVIAMLLVSTHSVWYDWALLVVAALFLVLRPASKGVRVELWIVLLALVVSAGQSTDALLEPDRHVVDWPRQEFYAVTLVAFASLVWMLTVAVREGLFQWPFSASRPLSRPLPGGS